jgi:hypothetical protein
MYEELADKVHIKEFTKLYNKLVKFGHPRSFFVIDTNASNQKLNGESLQGRIAHYDGATKELNIISLK